MNGADWVIVVVVLLSTVQAAYSGFFQEAFHLAGLVAGYLVAAWQYQRAGRLVGEVSEVGLAGRECWVPDYFFCSRGGRGYGRPDRPLGHEEVRSQFCGPASGWGVGVAAGLPDCGGDCGEHDRVYAELEVAGRFGVGSVFPGGGAGRHLGRSRGTAGQVLPGTGFAAPYAADRPRRCPAPSRAGEIGSSANIIGEQAFPGQRLFAQKERCRERSARSPYYADVPE